MKILVSCRLFIGPIPSSQTSQNFDTWLLTQGFFVWSHDLMERIQPLSSIKNCSIWLFAKNQIHKYPTLFNSRTSGWKIPYRWSVNPCLKSIISPVFTPLTVQFIRTVIIRRLLSYSHLTKGRNLYWLWRSSDDSSSFWIFEFIPGSQWSVTYYSDKNGYIFGFHNTVELRISL